MRETPPKSRRALRLAGWLIVLGAVVASLGAWARWWHEPHIQTRFYASFVGWALLVLASPRRGPRSTRAGIVVAVAGGLFALADVVVWHWQPPWQYWVAFVAVILFGFVAAPTLLLSWMADADDRAGQDAW